MRKSSRWTSLGLVATITLGGLYPLMGFADTTGGASPPPAGTAARGWRPGCGGRQKAMWGPGAGMMGGAVAFGELHLTAAQQRQIEQIQRSLWQKVRPLMRDMFRERASLQDMYLAKTPNASDIKAAYGRLQDIRRRIFDARVDGYARMANVLTPEQRKELGAWRANWGGGHGRGGMMGGW
ncbi:MAG: periplasmic heavy metal sensor [Betaproteobacteria bacterium]|nr:periplasmic heavy metal sensor [Betaproteobacteria bacterium]